jgi:uncharacterized membrane protein
MSTHPGQSPGGPFDFDRRRAWQVATAVLVATSLHVVPQLLKAWIDPALSMLLLMVFDALVFSAVVHSAGSLRIAAALAVMFVVVYVSRRAGLVALPSIGLNVMLAAVFAATLRKGRTPIIHAIAASAMQGEPVTPAFERHLRRVTLAWTVFFAVMAAACAVLGFAAPFAWWSFFANVLYWPIVLAMFLGEYSIRRTWLRDLPGHTPLQMIAAALAFPGDALRKVFDRR